MYIFVDQVETEETDFMDFDTVELDEDILTLIKLSDPTADKITFTVFLVNIILASFLIGYIPGDFYKWHTLVRSNVKIKDPLILGW